MKQKKWNLIWASFSMALLLAFCSSPAVLYAEEDGEVQAAAEEEADEDDVFIPDHNSILLRLLLRLFLLQEKCFHKTIYNHYI